MFNFQYEILLNKMNGRPYISPINETNKEMSFVEHKFMALELTRSIVTSTINLYESNPERHKLPPDEVERLKYLENEIIRFSDIFAVTIKEQFELVNIADRLINKSFDVSVDTEVDRDALNYNGFIFDDKIYKRIEGLKVKITNTGDVYELKGGIDNIHWVLI